MKRTALALVILLTATVVLASFFLFSSGALLPPIPPPSTPEGSAVPSAPNPTETPPTEAAPAPSESPSNSSSAPSLSTSPPLKPWPCSNQTPPDRTAQALAISSVYDPAGDTFVWSSEAPASGLGCIDIVYAEVIQINSTALLFSMRLADNIPPPYSQGYSWLLDTDMNFSTGNGRVPGLTDPNFVDPNWAKGYNDLGVDYVIYVGVIQMFSDAGIHRPVAWITQSPFPWSQITVSGDTITVTILLSDIGNPTSFYWIAAAHDTTAGFNDKVPNSGHVTLTTS